MVQLVVQEPPDARLKVGAGFEVQGDVSAFEETLALRSQR